MRNFEVLKQRLFLNRSGPRQCGILVLGPRNALLSASGFSTNFNGKLPATSWCHRLFVVLWCSLKHKMHSMQSSMLADYVMLCYITLRHIVNWSHYKWSMIANTTHALHDFDRCCCHSFLKIFTFNLAKVLQNDCSITKSTMHIWMWWLICALNMFIHACVFKREFTVSAMVTLAFVAIHCKCDIHTHTHARVSWGFRQSSFRFCFRVTIFIGMFSNCQMWTSDRFKMYSVKCA